MMDERECAKAPGPIRLFRRNADGTEELISDDWRLPEKKKRSGREIYRNTMVRRGHTYTYGGE